MKPLVLGPVPCVMAGRPCQNSPLPYEVLDHIFRLIPPQNLSIAVRVCKIWYSCGQYELDKYRKAQLDLRRWLYVETAYLFGDAAEQKRASETFYKEIDLSALKIEPIADSFDNTLCNRAFDFLKKALEYALPADSSQICSFIDGRIQRLIPSNTVFILDAPLDRPLDPYIASAISFLPQNIILFPSPQFENQIKMLDLVTVQKVFFSKRVLQYAQPRALFLTALEKCQNVTSLAVLTTYKQNSSEKIFSKRNGKTQISVFPTLLSTLTKLPNLLNISAEEVNFSDEDAIGLARYIRKGNERSKVVYCTISGTNKITNIGYACIAQALLSTERGFAISLQDVERTKQNQLGIVRLKLIPRLKKNVVIEVEELEKN